MTLIVNVILDKKVRGFAQRLGNSNQYCMDPSYLRFHFFPPCLPVVDGEYKQYNYFQVLKELVPIIK